MIVTTGLEPSIATLTHARELATRTNLPLIERRDASLDMLRQKHQIDRIIVVSAKGARLEASGVTPFFFHPNTAAFRIKRLMRGDTDTMLSACQITLGDEILDATLGLGADSIVFSYAVGPSGRVVGIESEELVAILIEDGLTHYQTEDENLREAMQRVEVIARNHADVLQDLPDHSFDVVYFDPMFSHAVAESSGIAALRTYANETTISEATIAHALRVARKRVVLKEGTYGKLYEQFGFTPFRSKAKQVVYSYREKDGGE